MAKINTKSKAKETKTDITDTTVSEIAKKPTGSTAGAIDSLFIEYYLETASRSKAYERACKAGGRDFKKKYAAQYGKAMFDRLKVQINNALISADVEDKALGRMVQRKLAQNAQSESVQASTSANLSKGLYPDVVQEADTLTYEQLQAKIAENDRLLDEQKTH